MGFFLVTDHFCKLSLKFETLYKRPRSLVQITLTRVFHVKILFQKVNRCVPKKRDEIILSFQISLVPLTIKKQPKGKPFYKSRQSYHKYLQLCLLKITTKCCCKLRQLFSHKLRQISYKLRQELQITTNQSI